jgi:ribosomal protein S18 acetylase RimI-like enzyme
MIRTAVKTDIDALAAFERRCAETPDPIDDSRVLERYWFHAVMGATTFVHQPDERAPISGFAVCRNSYLDRATRMEIQRVFVGAAARNGGVGTELIKTAINSAAAEGLSTFLYVWRRNPDAIRLYERLGFEEHRFSGDEKTLQMRRACERV